MIDEVRLDIAIRWEGPTGSDSRRQLGGGWVAYNVGAKPPYADRNWSTSLGAIDIEEVQMLFRNSNLLWLPPGEKDAEFAELDFTVVC